jgi:benzoyl-CoA reductase subunit C
MTASRDSNGLAAVERHYTQYGSRAMCPVEILTAAGVVPIRLKGSISEPVTKADAYMETIVCPFVRSVFDGVLKGRYELDGMVLPHQCDSIDRTNDVWSYNLTLPYWHFLNVPHVTDDPSLGFFLSILRVFIASLEKFTGRKITDEGLA